MIVFGAIAPHGDPMLEDGSATGAAMSELGRQLEAAAPETTILLTPHNVHVVGAFAVVAAGTVAGVVEEVGLELSIPVDRELAGAVLGALREADLPAVAVSFGSNDPELAEHPLDWGALLPLWFLGRDARPVVLVTPSRDRPLVEHVRAGAALAAATEGRRVALVASADHGHAHDPDGPFGFHPAAAEYDERLVAIVRENRLGDVLELEAIVADAVADSLWQLAMLHGGLGEGFAADLLSYEAPTYFGMLVAAYQPAGA